MLDLNPEIGFGLITRQIVGRFTQAEPKPALGEPRERPADPVILQQSVAHRNESDTSLPRRLCFQPFLWSWVEWSLTVSTSERGVPLDHGVDMLGRLFKHFSIPPLPKGRGLLEVER